jgi:hypothetical protein
MGAVTLVSVPEKILEIGKKEHYSELTHKEVLEEYLKEV